MPWLMSLSENSYVRIFVYFFYCLEGFYNSCWATVNPRIKDELSLSDVNYGWTIFMFSLGMVIITPFASWSLQSFGSKQTVAVGSFLMCLAITTVALSHSLAILLITMLYFGLSQGLMDISMNSAAVLTEFIAKKPILGSFHGSYSVSAAIGAQISAVFTIESISPLNIYLIYSTIGGLLCIMSYDKLYDLKKELEITTANDETNSQLDSKQNIAENENNNKSIFSVHNPVLFLGLVGFLAALGEGSITTWASIYFTRVLSTDGVKSSLGYSFFMIFMGTGRFLCDKIRARIGRQRLVFRAGLLMLIGCITIFLSSIVTSKNSANILIATLGFSLVGCGCSTLIPTMYSSAGHLQGIHSGTSISNVSFFTNSGCIVSGPLMGACSQLLNLQSAILVLGCICGTATILSYFIPYELNEIDKNKKLIYKNSINYESITTEDNVIGAPLLE
jgi:MFS family permease